MSDNPVHSVSVSGVTLDGAGRVLLIKRRDNGQWQAPGGILELDESFEEGVTREVLEETGVKVEVVRLTGVYKNLRRGVVALVYRCRAVGGFATPSEESSEVEWIDLDLVPRLMNQAFAVRVEDAVVNDGFQARSRVHDGVSLVHRDLGVPDP